MPLRPVPPVAAVPPIDTSRLLKAVLKAELAPGLTVEAACHAELHYDPDPDSVPELDEFNAHRALLWAAGLRYSLGNETVSDAVVLSNATAFKQKFPHLAAAVPVLKACGGVQLYTDGLARLPRTVAPPKLTLV